MRKLPPAFGGAGVTLVGDRGMMRSEQKAAAPAAGFPFSTALTQPQIQKLRADKVFPRELFAEDICAVSGDDGRRYVLRRNPGRPAERQRTRAEKQAALLAAWAKANTYLAAHPRAKEATQPRYLSERIQRLQAPGWRQLMLDQRRLVLTLAAAALQAAAQVAGCYVIATDLPAAQADAQTVHDRYKDLAFVERAFRPLKSGHLELRPWFVTTAAATQAHALPALLAVKVRRHLERAWWALAVTVEAGLRELEQLCVVELLQPESGQVVARRVPEPSVRQRQLLGALKLELPAAVPAAAVAVGTRKKIQQARKTLEK